ncbi:MAG: hypothetical protein ABW215_22255 [Kibdelosporangium sp.]
MVSFVFSVDDDPPHSGFSLGHLDVAGSDGVVSTRGHRPDQRLMVYLSAAQLLWDVRVLLDAGKGHRVFVGADSTFKLTLGYSRSTVETRQGAVLVDRSAADSFTAAVLDSAKALFAIGVAEVEEDHVGLTDLDGAINRYESWQIARHLP